MDEKKTLGVLGGLGPMSSVYFYELVTENTLAGKDQDHMNIVISSKAATPDRTAFILGQSDEDPLPVMREEAKKLAGWGAGIIALTCNTAHYFYEALQESVDVPILNIGALAVEMIKLSGAVKVGLLATDGTVKCGIYQSACADKGIECIVPGKEDQLKVMDIIYNQIKTGKRADMNAFNCVSEGLLSRGAEVVILGCTELSLIKRSECLTEKFIDPLEILAKASILKCGYKLSDGNVSAYAVL